MDLFRALDSAARDSAAVVSSGLDASISSGLAAAVDRFDGDDDPGTACRCVPSFETTGHAPDDRTVLFLDASACDHGGVLADSPDCRATVIDALAARDAESVRTRAPGVERAYEGRGAALLLAAGRFVERVAHHDDRLADRARSDPLGAAHAARGRTGPVARIAAETGLSEATTGLAGYDEALRAHTGPPIAQARVAARPPPGARLVETRELPSGATAATYETDRGRTYHLRPQFRSLSSDALETLDLAATALADGRVAGGERGPGRAVRLVATDDDPVERLAAVLGRHTRGHGVLGDLFVDPRVTDVFVTPPVRENPVRVTLDGRRVPTNVRLTRRGVATLASRFRRASGRGFSRASPTLDAAFDAADGRRIRVAGVTDPASDGLGFAFRVHDGVPLTLPGLVENGTLPARAAALLSVAVERAASLLVAGARGAGKTTLLGSLLWELPAATRTVLVEDTPELPAAALRDAGRDVQRLRVDTGGGGSALTPTEALRTALRLGDGALVVGEVRGREAETLYEAMRVGASSEAVLGTIHGDGADAVRERVVTDLGVPASSFAATDLVVTVSNGERRRVTALEELRAGTDGVGFAPLFDLDGTTLESTDAMDRGNSRLLADIAAPGETYADVLEAVESRRESLAALAAGGRTRPADVADAYLDRGAT
jgi:type IV secretory pathway ATPase VirB11/archaellum biosynthesis ATPase